MSVPKREEVSPVRHGTAARIGSNARPKGPSTRVGTSCATRLNGLFVAPVPVLLSGVVGPTPMDLRFWPGAVVMILIVTVTASLMTNSGKSAWFVGVLLLMVYLIFAMTLYMLPPRVE